MSRVLDLLAQAGVVCHPACLSMPVMSDEDFGRFVDDVRDNGLRERVAFYHDGRLLDGRHRIAAWFALGCSQPLDEISCQVDECHCADKWVWSYNVARRHLTLNQRVDLALHLREMLAAEEEAGTTGGVCPGTHVPQESGNSGRLSARAGKMVDVSPRTVDRRRYIESHAAPEVLAAWRNTDVSIRAAYEIAKSAPDDRAAQIDALNRHVDEANHQSKNRVVERAMPGDFGALRAVFRRMTDNQRDEAINYWLGWRSMSPVHHELMSLFSGMDRASREQAVALLEDWNEDFGEAAPDRASDEPDDDSDPLWEDDDSTVYDDVD